MTGYGTDVNTPSGHRPPGYGCKVGEHVLYKAPHPVFKVGKRIMRNVAPDINEQTLRPLTCKHNQRCWLCRKTVLVPKVNAYEILLTVLYRKLHQWKKKRVICCDNCLENTPALRDAEILGFGDGVRLIDFCPSDERIGNACKEIRDEFQEAI
jgi:hypothetical protein